MASKGPDKSEKKMEKSRFSEGEKVLCYHGPLIYEAKCINVKISASGPEYLIHYNGWNKSWDEWVVEDRLLKFNEQNLEKKDELHRKNHLQKKSNKRRTSIGSVGDKDENNSRSNSPKPTPGRKSTTVLNRINIGNIEKQDFTPTRKKKDFIHSPELEYYEHIMVTVQFPDDLRFLLSYDLELICKRKKITKLPAKVTVDDITDKYVLHKTSLFEAPLASKFKETAYALRQYFNVVLSKKLLYAFEKPQYNKLVENKMNFVPSSTYSVIHFIRLFVFRQWRTGSKDTLYLVMKIGHLLAHLPLDDYGINIIEETINDYVRYLNLNINKFISIDDYQSTSVDYQRKVKEILKT